MTRGFITVATGDRYRALAANLLASYRLHTKNPLPFAVLTDRETAQTAAFDRCVVLEHPGGNYLDKLALGEHILFDEQIFIDADCLAYGDLNRMFAWFSRAEDVSCHGRVLSLADNSGWFDPAHLGQWRDRVDYCVGLHGGVYYMRRSEQARRVFALARELAGEYDRFHFRGNFPTPGDEPLMALAMAVEKCRPIPCHPEGICCRWENKRSLRLDILRGRARVGDCRPVLVHFGTRFTDGPSYRMQAALLKWAGRKFYG